MARSASPPFKVAVVWRGDARARAEARPETSRFAAVFAALMGDATFRADLDRARAELRAALAGPGTVPDQAACTREATALREPPLEF